MRNAIIWIMATTSFGMCIGLLMSSISCSNEIKQLKVEIAESRRREDMLHTLITSLSYQCDVVAERIINANPGE
jgi:uncharacterized coiled-coil DUF342 family protein